jgi:RNA polymerase sigma-70 factor (ECF subfamily)
MPAPPDADADLMLRVKRGDREAFDALMQRWQQPVISFIYRTLPDADEAEDLSQAVFVQLWKAPAVTRSRPGSAPSSSPSPATSASTSSAAAPGIRRIRSTRRPRMTRPIPTARSRTAGRPPPARPPRAPSSSPRCRRPRRAARKQRTAILLCREGELSYEEIADLLGTSLQATKSLIHRGRETLKARLKPIPAHRRMVMTWRSNFPHPGFRQEARMNTPDPNADWLDAVESRRLTPAETEALRRRLENRPRERARLAEELALNAALDSLPKPAASSNFAARVGPISSATKAPPAGARPVG